MTEAIRELQALRAILRSEGDIKGTRTIDRAIKRLRRAAKEG